MTSPEHLLIAEAGTEEGSRYAIMVGVRVDSCDAIATRLIEPGEGRVLETLRELAFEIRIAFASKQKLASIGDDWQYAFLREIVCHSFNPNRPRRPGYPLVAHLPQEIPLDRSWLDAYLTNATAGLIRVQTKVLGGDDRVLALPRLVARLFHDALEDDFDRPSPARDRYDALAPLVTHIEDLGLNVSYCNGGTNASALLRTTGSS